ncbi:MAG TPA: hypothetical protein VKV79_08200 [Terriglobia bacterium]|nr:hypothetical protein [Terriglobia bacterium]
MNQTHNSVENSIRKAFELLLEIRGHRHAEHLLDLANGYLRLLASRDSACLPVVTSIRAVRIREP